MNFRKMTVKEIEDLATETYKDGSYDVETEECVLCAVCKEWPALVYCFDKDGNEIDEVSNCCGSDFYEH
jgi:hypothetical protein